MNHCGLACPFVCCHGWRCGWKGMISKARDNPTYSTTVTNPSKYVFCWLTPSPFVVVDSSAENKNGPCKRLPIFILQEAFCHCQRGALARTSRSMARIHGIRESSQQNLRYFSILGWILNHDEWLRQTMTNILHNLVRVKKHGYNFNPPRNVNWFFIVETGIRVTWWNPGVAYYASL